MQTFFSATFFTKNRNKLVRSLAHKSPVVITGNGVMQLGADEAQPFVQDSTFWYLTGITAPNLTLVIDENETYLIVPTISFEREAFDGVQDVAYYSERSGITTILDDATGWKKLKDSLQKSKHAHTLFSFPAYMKRHGLHTLPYRRRLIERLKRAQVGITLVDIRPQIATLRCIKQPEELLALQKAIDITSQSLSLVRKLDFLQSVQYEYEIEAMLAYEFRKQGAEGLAFSSVVGAGVHATTLHHTENNGPVAAGDVVVLDVGASVEHYAADITRTVSAEPLSGRKLAVYQAVLDVQNFALDQIKPGILPVDYEKSVEGYMGNKLMELNLITEPSREHIRHYFPHATSHFLGLDVHDVGNYGAPYQPGMVITCEPGIYIPEEGIGVRIEDDVLVTANGYEVLSKACSRDAF